MPLNFDPAAADNAVVALLRADPGVQAISAQDENGGVHDGVAANGNDPPYVVVSVASDMSEYFLGKLQQVSDISYLIRTCGQTKADADALAKAVGAALNFASLSVAGSAVLNISREGGGQRYADGDGFYNNAAYYRLTLQGS